MTRKIIVSRYDKDTEYKTDIYQAEYVNIHNDFLMITVYQSNQYITYPIHLSTIICWSTDNGEGLFY